jgi:hypothetical protein
MQIKADLSVADGKRIEKIIKTYGFKSVYEFAKAVVMVFIKANDPREDEILPENLKEIFTQQVDTKIKHNHETKP